MAKRGDLPCLYVLAGPNGAGKSAILGATIERHGAAYFNPDREASRLRAADPALTQEQANSAAWLAGKTLLEKAIARRQTFALETTLGGHTIPALLAEAADSGLEVRIVYVGLRSPELHIARVKARVARGGHPIREADIRRRFETSQENLIRLMPRVASLKVYDNSAEADPRSAMPLMKLVLHWERGQIVGPKNLSATPPWAKAIVAAAMRLAIGRREKR